MTVSPAIICFKCAKIIERKKSPNCDDHFGYAANGEDGRESFLCDSRCPHAPNQKIYDEIVESMHKPCQSYNPKKIQQEAIESLFADLDSPPEAIITATSTDELNLKIENYYLQKQFVAHEETLEAYQFSFEVLHEAFGILAMHLIHWSGNEALNVPACKAGCSFDSNKLRFVSVCKDLPHPEELKYNVPVVGA